MLRSGDCALRVACPEICRTELSKLLFSKSCVVACFGCPFFLIDLGNAADCINLEAAPKRYARNALLGPGTGGLSPCLALLSNLKMWGPLSILGIPFVTS